MADQMPRSSADGGQQEPGGSQLAVSDGPQVRSGGQEMPECFTFGTKKAFEKNYPFPYRLRMCSRSPEPSLLLKAGSSLAITAKAAGQGGIGMLVANYYSGHVKI